MAVALRMILTEAGPHHYAVSAGSALEGQDATLHRAYFQITEILHFYRLKDQEPSMIAWVRVPSEVAAMFGWIPADHPALQSGD